MTPPVTLQISLAPSDFAHAQHLLTHQVERWRAQVSEVLLTIDFHRSPGRFSARWTEGKDRIAPLAQSIPGARVLEVDYSARSAVAAAFFNHQDVPEKDYRGGPYYSYFFGLHAARHDHVLHVDSDMFFGGGSGHWIGEALERLARRPEIFAITPLLGPPSSDGSLRQLHATRSDPSDPSHDFPELSTRLFLVDRRRFRTDFGKISAERPSLRGRFNALIDGNHAWELPEVTLSRRMAERRMVYHAFLGSAPGMWCLHPPFRCHEFYERLPELIRRVEAGDIPAAQRGDHDMNDSMVDWTEGITALRTNRWWRRLARRVGPRS